MSQIGDAAKARFQKLLESAPFRDHSWVQELQQRMEGYELVLNGRPVCPFLRPNFVTKSQFRALVRTTTVLLSAIHRLEQMALRNPALLARIDILPAERMLASIDPGYQTPPVDALFDTSIYNGSLQFVDRKDLPVGVALGEAIADLFYETPIVQEFRRKYPLTKLGGKQYLLDALLRAYREFGGKGTPNIAILHLSEASVEPTSREFNLLKQFFISKGFPTEIVTPDTLEYRNGQLRSGKFRIDLIYRHVRVREFLLRYDLTHPLLQAYRDRAVCVVNSFRSEILRKRSIFELLTDDRVVASFPEPERRVIREHIPWTRTVGFRRTTYKDQVVDLLDFILKNRERLILKPNDGSADHPPYYGWQTDELGWERALRKALHVPYVVQERVETATEVFPVLFYGDVVEREMEVQVSPYAFLGTVTGCTSWLKPVQPVGFSSLSGLAPTYLLGTR